MVNLLFMHDDELLTKPNTVRTLLDPTCGTGGMLSEARKYLREHQMGARFTYTAKTSTHAPTPWPHRTC
jgi:type I restriction enzyme M protein